MKRVSLLLDIDGTNENYFDFVLENKLTYVVLLNNTLTANVRLQIEIEIDFSHCNIRRWNTEVSH